MSACANDPAAPDASCTRCRAPFATSRTPLGYECERTAAADSDQPLCVDCCSSGPTPCVDCLNDRVAAIRELRAGAA